MNRAGSRPENSETVEAGPMAEDLLAQEESVTGAWTAMVLSVWRLAEVLYGPCFAPLGGTWVMMDGNGLMMSCADAPDPGDQASPDQPTH